MNNKKKLIIFPVNGLCNRIMGIAGGMAIADMYNLDTIIHWLPGNEDCNADFYDIFESSIIPVHTDTTLPSNNFSSISPITNDRLTNLATIYDHQPITQTDQFYEICNFIQRTIREGKDVVLITHTKMPHSTHCDYYIRNILKYCPVKKSIRDEINNQKNKSKHFDKALHLRLTDNQGEYMDDEYMDEIIEKVNNKDEKILIFTDDPIRANRLAMQIPNSKFVNSKVGRSKEAVQDAMKDLILMSQFSNIYITKTKYTSSFSNVASIIGKNKTPKL